MGLRIVLERVGAPRCAGRGCVRGPGGKPHLRRRRRRRFSLAHTDGMALIGVARAGAVGVDLEAAARAAGCRAAAARRSWPSPPGLPAGRTAMTPAADDTLLRAWCRLEAFAKARGEGLSHLLGELGLREAGGRQLAGGQIAAAARRLARRAGLEDRRPQTPAWSLRGGGGGGLAQPPRLRRFPADLAAIRALLPTRG